MSCRCSSPNYMISSHRGDIRRKWAKIGPFSPKISGPFYGCRPLEKRVLVSPICGISHGGRSVTGSRQSRTTSLQLRNCFGNSDIVSPRMDTYWYITGCPKNEISPDSGSGDPIRVAAQSFFGDITKLRTLPYFYKAGAISRPQVSRWELSTTASSTARSIQGPQSCRPQEVHSRGVWRTAIGYENSQPTSAKNPDRPERRNVHHLLASAGEAAGK